MALLLVENDDDDTVSLHIEGPGQYSGLTASSQDFFSALVELRAILEKTGSYLRCAGTCREVYPSGMARGMGSGRKAYRLTLGKQARTADLVDIFSDIDCPPCSIQEQEQFFHEWLSSLR